MRRLLAALAGLALVAGCPDKPQDETTPDDGLPHPLSEADRKALHVPEGLPDALPEGAKTPVRLVRSDRVPEGPYGFWFSVNPARARFVVHALRRTVARLVLAAPDAGTPDDGEKAPEQVRPFVYEAGAAGDGRTKVVVLFRPAAEEDAVADCDALYAEQFVTFLHTWKEKTGATVYSSTKEALELEVDRLPAEENAFLDDLARFTLDPADPDQELPRPVRDLRERLTRDHRLTLP